MINLYKVTNHLRTSLVIEDIGVTLQSQGGVDSSRTITANMLESSSDLKRMLHMKWVSVSSRPAPAPKRPVPVWPLSLRDVRDASPPVPAHPAPAPPAQAPAQAPDPVMADYVARLEGKMAEILSALRSSPGASAPAGARDSLPDPVFLPSKMVPDADARISVDAVETDAAGFDASKGALSKLRKKK